jgi:predicted amidophosphoribosyltransferase
MAIIQCPNCGNSISDKAPMCPKCGYSINTQQVVINQPGLEWYMWVALLCTGWIVSLIYYVIQKDKAPQKAKQALVCLWINLAFWVIVYGVEL